MTIFQAIILGIVQGLTEFLPISSSAHLVLVPFLFNWKIPEAQIFPFDVLVQLGTLVAVIIYFRNDLWNIIRGFIQGILSRKPFESDASKLGWYLILATIPAGIFGLLIKDLVEKAFNSPAITAGFLFVTAALLVASEEIGKRKRNLNEMTWKDALWIGGFQALAIFPGISRSGSTIAGGLFRGIKRQDAGRFSFLMSIPIMVAAGGLGIKDLFEVPNLSAFLLPMAIGFIVAGIVGYFSIRWLLGILARRPLHGFAIYCVGFAMVCLLKFFIA